MVDGKGVVDVDVNAMCLESVADKRIVFTSGFPAPPGCDSDRSVLPVPNVIVSTLGLDGYNMSILMPMDLQ
eukprot:5104415-Prorocentrum_lima.AAC.1